MILCLFTPWRKGCLRESAAEIRFEGSRVNILSIRSRGASGMMLGKGRETGDGVEETYHVSRIQ